MSGLRKKLGKMIEIAQDCANEAAFQNDTQYKTLKSKIKIKSAHSNDIKDLIKFLKVKKFYKEGIHWCEELLKITDMCNKVGRSTIFKQFIEIYIATKNNEMVVEYGKKTIQLIQGTNMSKYYTLYQIGNALIQLKRFKEAMVYLNKENLQGMHSILGLGLIRIVRP